MMPKHAGPRPSSALIADVAQAVANEFGVRDALLFRRPAALGRNSANVGLARHVAQYLVSVSLGFGPFATSEVFGFDRTVVTYASKRIEEMRDDPRFEARIARLEREFEYARAAA